MTDILRIQNRMTGPDGLSITSGQVYSFPTHAHAYYEMTCYAPAPASVSVNGQKISLQTPCILLMTPSDFHRIQAEQGPGGYYIKAEFDESVLAPAARGFLDAPRYLAGEEEMALPRLLFEEMHCQRSCTEYAAQLLSSLVMLLGRKGDSLAPGGQQRCHALVLQATRILNEQFAGPVTLSSLAAALSVSPQYFSQIFSQAMGIPFQEYLSALRLRLAAEWLRESDRSVTDICFGCGYRNLSHFLRSFKRRYGLSPLQYRLRNGESGKREEAGNGK